MTPFGNLVAPPAFQCLVNHNLDSATHLYEGADQQLEQQTAQCETGPACSIEHLMEQSEIRLIVQTHLLESGSDGAPPTSQNGPDHQHECFMPGRASENWSEMEQNLYNRVG